VTLPFVHLTIPPGIPVWLEALLVAVCLGIPMTLRAFARYRKATMPQASRDRRAVIEGGRAYRLQRRREKWERSEARRLRREHVRASMRGAKACESGCHCQAHEAAGRRSSGQRSGKSPS
jgi:hypothetical protein